MSTLEHLPDELGRAWAEWVVASARRWMWLVPGLLAGLCVYVSYILTHSYPAFGAGLFLAMSERVIETAPMLPETVPGYTARGVPLAYPPLLFYVTGLLLEATALGPFEISVHLPHVVSILALVPLYLFAERLLGSRRAAGLATLLAATAPPLLQWQISGGGIVRSPAYLFTIVGLYTGLRLFTGGDRRWILPSLAAFAMTVLTHPVYTVFFVLSYLTMYAAFDATPRGLVRGAAVGFGGAVLSSPWWLQVTANHGFDVLTGAAGTHGGIGKQIPDLVMLFIPEGRHTQAVLFATRPELFDFSTLGMGLLTVWSLAIVAAWFALLWRNRRVTFLTGWAILSVVFVSKPRFSFLIGALMIGAILDREALPAIDVRDERTTRFVRVAIGVFVVTAATTTGIMYAGSHLDTHAGSTSQPAFVDDADVEAMEWVSANTRPDDTFVVIGDSAEWFPYATDRTMLVGPWGVEWRGQERYEAQLKAFNRLSTCETMECLTVQIQGRGYSPDYVYVPKGQFTVRGVEMSPEGDLHGGLTSSDRYRVVYENDGVAIYEYVEMPEPPVHAGQATLMYSPAEDDHDPTDSVADHDRNVADYDRDKADSPPDRARIPANTRADHDRAGERVVRPSR